MTGIGLRAEILSQGEEVVAGEIADTNAAWLSTELTSLGIDVVRHTAVGDRFLDLVAALREIEARSQLCICTGGLGPTCDDLTGEAVAAAFESPLALDEVALQQIRDYFEDRHRAMPEINRKQAMLPASASRIDNRWGTAPGFQLRTGRCDFFFLPGVPSEMREMYRHAIAPVLASRFEIHPRHTSVFRTFGLGESQLQELLEGLGLPESVALGFRVDMPYVDVKLQFVPPVAASERHAWEAAMQARLGDCVFSQACSATGTRPARLAEAVDPLMRAGNLILAVVETVSGGALASQLADLPWFVGATVVSDLTRLAGNIGLVAPCLGYDGERKDWLADLARAYRIWTQADVVIVQDGGEVDRVSMALIGPGFERFRERHISGDLKRRQLTAAAWALDELRRQLMERV